MQRRRSRNHSDPFTNAVAWILIVALVYVVVVTSGCITIDRDSGDEPLWRPNVYLYSPTPDNHCQFVNGAGHILDCDEPLIHDHFLAPLEDLVTLKSKLHQCETWR